MNIVGAQIQQVSWHAIFSPWKGLVRTLITRVFIPLAQAKGKKTKGQQTQCKVRSEANAKSQKPEAKSQKAKGQVKPKPKARGQTPKAKWSQMKPSEANNMEKLPQTEKKTNKYIYI